jgi:DNA-(apurinic or apyrimidinic site) lyase
LGNSRKKELSLSKTEKLIELLKEFSLKEVEEVELRDRQFVALKELYRNLEDRELFFKLVLINALLSYQLQMKGEDYWEAFSEFFKWKKGVEDFPEFLSKYNRRFLTAKLKRFEKVKPCVEELFKRFSLDELGSAPSLIADNLARCLNQSKSAKTVVFAVKMFSYAYKIAFGKFPDNLWDVEIPLDSRLKRLISSVKEWREVAEAVGIPPIRLDALIWVPMGESSENLNKFPPSLREKLLKLKEITG